MSTAGGMAPKEAAARRAIAEIDDGMVLGLGSGSTVDHAIIALGERVKAGLRVRLVVASRRSDALARQCGLTPLALDDYEELDRVIDGADEIDPQLNLIKGGGGALVREKLLALAGREFVVIADGRKRVPALGAFPLPVAILPFGARQTLRRLAQLCPEVSLRELEGQPVVTDDGLWIADLRAGRIEEPARLERGLKAITGVVDVGLFSAMARRAILGFEDGVTQEITPVSPG